MGSTFSSFYIAKSGIQAARANLQVTGQNMANVNTEGYTRQRVDSYAVGSNGNNMRYSNKNELAIGEGVFTAGISQYRDPYLDVRYRMENTKTGKSTTELGALNDMETVFDEIKKNGIDTQFQDLVAQLKTLAGNPSDKSLENIVKNSSLLLTQSFHNAAQQLSDVRDEQTYDFEKNALTKVNSLLQNIAHINQEIKSADISETPALELRDQRNQMLDQLSSYVSIQLTTKTVPIGGGRSVDELNVNLLSDNQTINLISNDQYNHFTLKKDASGATQENPIEIQLKDPSDQLLTLSNSDVTSGTLGGYLSMLNDSGEYDATTTTRGIGFYQKTLDKLAYEFASMMNQANSTNDPANDNKPLFSKNSTTDTKITAGNICISQEWNTAEGSYVTGTKKPATPGVDNSKLGDNILYMVSQFTKDTTFTTDQNNNTASPTIFSSSINSFMSNLSITLGLQIKTEQAKYDTFASNLNDVDTQRSAVSSVDVNEEGINLIMYNQALSASSRFMTTMDEALDTIINRMGVIGR